MNIRNARIVVIGLGYVGLPLAVEFGKKRYVLGFDINKNRVQELINGYDHTREVEKADLIAARYLRFTSDSSLLLGPLDGSPTVFIVTVPTPVDNAKRPDLSALINASEIVGRNLKGGDFVIYESTVFPGATEEVCVPILERESGLEYCSGSRERSDGDQTHFYCGYSPERINPGDKSHRLPEIKKVTSGSTPGAALAVDDLYNEIIVAGTHMASSIKVAEAAKVIENAQRDLNIAFVNELSVIFSFMQIDTSEVLAAAATKWNFLPFKPGLVGGHCIGVDPYYLTHKAQELGYQPQVILSGRRINDDMARYVAQNVIRLMLKNSIDVSKSSVGVLGITFKENCPDVRNSKVFDIISELKRWGVQVRVMDPLANAEEVWKYYGLDLVEITPANPVDSLIVAVSHDHFGGIPLIDLRRLCNVNSVPVIADLKCLFDQKQLELLGFCVFRL